MVSVQGEHKTFVTGSEHVGLRLDQFLCSVEPTLSRTRWQALIESGSVQLNGQRAKPGNVLRAGDLIEADLPLPTQATPTAEPIALTIVYEDNHVIVVDKPAGMAVHPGPGHWHGTLVNALLFYCKDLSGIGGVLRPGIVHRLDKDTSGLIVAAKNDTAHLALAKQFERHTIHRAYIAIAWGPFRFKRGTLQGTIDRDPHHRLRMTGKTGRGRHAITHYEVQAATPHFARVRCTLETGRTHQIRVHLAEAGHPIVGDPLYGKSRCVSPRMGTRLQKAVKTFPRQALHAGELGFILPTGERLQFTSSLPRDMVELWRLMEEEDRA